MRKQLLLGLAVVLMFGFNLGCEPPPEGPDNGGYEQQAPANNPYGQDSGQEPGDYQ